MSESGNSGIFKEVAGVVDTVFGAGLGSSFAFFSVQGAIAAKPILISLVMLVPILLFGRMSGTAFAKGKWKLGLLLVLGVVAGMALSSGSHLEVSQGSWLLHIIIYGWIGILVTFGIITTVQEHLEKQSND